MPGTDECWPVYHLVFLPFFFFFFTDSTHPVHSDLPFGASIDNLPNPHLILLNKSLKSKPTSVCWMLAVLCFIDIFSSLRSQGGDRQQPPEEAEMKMPLMQKAQHQMADFRQIPILK